MGLFTRRRAYDRLGIVRIIFLTLDERLHIGGRNEPDVMAKLDQFPPPEVRASTSLHHHHTRRQRREESQHLRAPQLLSKQCAAASICSVELEYILRQIESDSGNLRHDRLTEWIVAIPPWHIDAVGGRLHHQSHQDLKQKAASNKAAHATVAVTQKFYFEAD